MVGKERLSGFVDLGENENMDENDYGGRRLC